ncbi:hypothetical protein CHARACLAT_018888 [Characodon lateralis]|uniref:Uncharacterized protein n=1 Tax=Characodon lateralis TaxID=208331 RepID=A0ABU7ELK9_9TELE|nr:hypothetical protein [Characodon lateralis]
MSRAGQQFLRRIIEITRNKSAAGSCILTQRKNPCLPPAPQQSGGVQLCAPHDMRERARDRGDETLLPPQSYEEDRRTQLLPRLSKRSHSAASPRDNGLSQGNY